ncbi:MAG: hypothetical protein IT317_14010 [Anaerolineales bacterium]|nr:hypothetical protein [Anaerolineales bacterium]
MIALETAKALRAAGLRWEPAEFDMFAVPDRDLEETPFVINDLPAHMGRLQGIPVMTFDGSAEWALDYIAAGEVVWLPSEEQLRWQLMARLAADPAYRLSLAATGAGCRLTTTAHGATREYEAAEAGEAYAAALLALLRAEQA